MNPSGWMVATGWALAVAVAAEEVVPSHPASPAAADGRHDLSLTTIPDTVPLPREWPAAFPLPPEGSSVAGVTQIESAELGGAPSGPYFIVAVDLPGTEAEGFLHYREALARSGWEIVEPLTNDGSRPGLVTLGFRGHEHAGDIRFQQVLGTVLATIHLYREDGRS